jgi:four helix bundle protein
MTKDDGNDEGRTQAVMTEENENAFLPSNDARSERVYDLEERTAKFGEAIVRFAQKIPPTAVNLRLIGQLVGCGTSIGANYCEADDAVSRKDFMNRIGTARKESRETKFFLRMVASAEPSLADGCRVLWQEAHELNRIFASIFRQR